jgi:hypothetical protein
MDHHYVCTGTCNLVSDHPGTCQNPDCPQHGKELVVCECIDGNHDDAFKKSNQNMAI